VALALIRARRAWPGALLLFAAMLGALLFGLAYHYMLPGPDHVAHVPGGPWQLPFQITSALLVATEAAGTAVGAWALLVTRRAAARSA
jgi:hypothetical protein